MFLFDLSLKLYCKVDMSTTLRSQSQSQALRPNAQHYSQILRPTEKVSVSGLHFNTIKQRFHSKPPYEHTSRDLHSLHLREIDISFLKKDL